jgi:sRNA-binding protein
VVPETNLCQPETGTLPSQGPWVFREGDFASTRVSTSSPCFIHFCFFRAHELPRPLKIGIHNDIIALQPELQPALIASALRAYTRSIGYLETLKAGAARIDLESNPVGTVTAAGEADAKRKIAKAARRAAAKAIQDRKGKSATVADLPSSPVAATPQAIAPAGPPRLGFAGLKAAAQARRARLVAAK